MEQHIMLDLQERLRRSLARGTYNQKSIDAQLTRFQELFGPQVLRDVDGESLLRLLHGRREDEPRCMMYWMEFKNDDEFSFQLFGGIAGGSAFKYGMYDKQPEDVWIVGSAKNSQNATLENAIELARKQRDELVAGAQVLAKFDAFSATDQECADLDVAMRQAAPSLASVGWAHKYWFLIFPDRLDSFHSPQRQRFHLLKLLQLPPDGVGTLDATASRFVCVGRFLALARELKTSPTILCKLLGERHPQLNYWKVGTTSGAPGGSQWPVMKAEGLVSIGWKSLLGDLAPFLKESDLKKRVADKIFSEYSDQKVATRKAGEIVNFAKQIEINDVVIACEGAVVRAVGQVTGPYEYRPELDFPHTRTVRWLSFDEWKLDPLEGPQTTVFPFGKYPGNVLHLERQLASAHPASSDPVVDAPKAGQLKPLDSWSSRIEAALKRKGQVILYGPPGTGKTWRALRLVKELAARHAFQKSADHLDEGESNLLIGEGAMVRICTFHPNWGYEDFLEGLRPQAIEGVISFRERDGLFKTLCLDAERAPKRNFYLVIDEINRGDLPRIFGELMTVMEVDKRDQAITLPVSGSQFSIPPNVFMVGTMNTADRSISLLDAAVRRRFAFFELMPDTGSLAGKVVRGLPLGPWLAALNIRVRKYLKRDARNLQVGHAYLLPAAGVQSFADFALILRDEIIPLIEEYCYDDFHTLQKILGKELVDVEAGRIVDDLFEPAREQDLLQAVRYEEIEMIVVSETQTQEDEGPSAEDGEGNPVSADPP